VMTELSLWRVTDGVAGHESQTRGLVEAIGRLTPTVTRDVPAGGLATCIGTLVRDWWAAPPEAAPDLILCSGHRTHLAALVLRLRFGGHTVVLMRPSLPLRCFDLVVAPRHDALKPSDRVLVTEGAINAIRPGGPHHRNQGLILIGGPSRHHSWSSSGVAAQIESIFACSPTTSWTIGTSRRTPVDTTSWLLTLCREGIDVVMARDTPPGWVASRLAQAGQVWVSEDSISMIYEAITAGVPVGLLEVPRRRSDRVTRAIDGLASEGRITRHQDFVSGKDLPEPRLLAEADRVARQILHRWFPDRLDGRGPC